MSNIKFYLFSILLIVPLLIFSQKRTFNQSLKVDINQNTFTLISIDNFFKFKKTDNFIKYYKVSEKLTFANQNHYGIIVLYKKLRICFLDFNPFTKLENKLKKNAEYEYTYIIITLFFILIGGAFAYYKHVKGTNIILHQKNKLDEINATKDLLLTIVSHDLRASVNALKTSNSKLIDSLETKNYNKLDLLLHQNSIIVNGAYNLLDNILHWVLLQTKELYFHKDSAHLFSIVKQIEYNYKPLLTEKQIMYTNSVSKNCFVFVDIDSLKIVLRNLFDNAIKFSNNNGKICIYTQETNSNFCKLIIEDTGIGIDQNTIKELLKENKLICKKNNSKIKGTGLGIQLCKQMIKKNNGMIDIKSKLKTGTKIIISIPKVV